MYSIKEKKRLSSTARRNRIHVDIQDSPLPCFIRYSTAAKRLREEFSTVNSWRRTIRIDAIIVSFLLNFIHEYSASRLKRFPAVHATHHKSHCRIASPLTKPSRSHTHTIGQHDEHNSLGIQKEFHWQLRKRQIITLVTCCTCYNL